MFEWVTPAGLLLVAAELNYAYYNLEVNSNGNPVTFKLISGSLPPGMSLDSSIGQIYGTPLAVLTLTRSNFVIRATSNGVSKDRTFSIDVSGVSPLNWITTSNWLTVGISNEPYALNKQYVYYQLSAVATNSPADTKLTYFIAKDNGKLPPGLTLSSDGIISGFVKDNLIYNENQSKSGGYDTESYDGYTYDHYADIGSTSTNIGIPKIYNFKVSATDGISNSTTSTKILVINSEILRKRAGRDLLPADIQKELKPQITKVFSTGSFYALYGSSDNSIKIKVLGNDWVSTIDLEKNEYFITNELRYPGKLAKIVSILREDITYLITTESDNPFQYGFGAVETVPSILTPLYDCKIITSIIDYTVLPQFIKNSNLYDVRANNNVDIDVSAYDPAPLEGNVTYTITTTTNLLTHLPEYLQLDANKGRIYGYVPYQPAYAKNYSLTINAIKNYKGNVVTATNTFSLIVKGEIESTIEWVTPEDLGNFEVGQISTLFVEAKQLNSNYSIKYQITSGSLPPGLTLQRDGTITGIINYGKTGVYHFNVEASDVYGLSSISRTFTLTAYVNSTKKYTKIYLKPFMSLDLRQSYQDFINNEFTFPPNLLYRYFDPNFGIQTDIKLYLEFGIENVDLSLFREALNENFYKKRFCFGDPKIAIAKDTDGNIIYEVVYLELYDDQTNGLKKSVSPVFYNENTTNYIFYPSSIDNMRTQLEKLVLPDFTFIGINEDFSPRFMQTAQNEDYRILGYLGVVPLCYVLPGNGSKIISRIKISKFDFKMLDFEADRLIVEGINNGEPKQYLRFSREHINSQIDADQQLFGPDGILVDYDNTTE